MLFITSPADKAVKNCPKDFVFLSTIDPTIIEYPRYATKENFLGFPVYGYIISRIICTKTAALALKKVNAALIVQGYRLVVYDAYRPQKAVNAFIQWSKDGNQINKRLYFPTLEKKDLFKLGYIAKKSGHSRGSTFDLTIIPLYTDLGSKVACFGPL